MIKRLTLSCIHWLEFVNTEYCHDVIFVHVQAIARMQRLFIAGSFRDSLLITSGGGHITFWEREHGMLWQFYDN